MIEPFETVTAKDLAEMPMPSEAEWVESMIDRLLHAPSCVRFGDWKYDKVHAALVMELLDYLHERLREVGK